MHNDPIPSPEKDGASQDALVFRLPNAKQNQPFEVDLQTVDGFPPYAQLQVLNDGETGFILSNNTVLSGVPAVSGDCILQLQGMDTRKHSVSIELTLLVNPDPRTLWNDIEPTTDLFRKPHRAFQRYTHSDKGIGLTAARIRGRAHAHKGSFCEDDTAILYDERLGCFGMVSDGAGSAKFSRLASQVLTDSVPRHLQRAFDERVADSAFLALLDAFDSQETTRVTELQTCLEKLLGDAVYQAFSGLMEYVNLGNVFQIKDLYATCLVFWALPLDERHWALTSYWVGDGGLAIAHDDTVTLSGTPDSGEFSGQTRFLTAEELTKTAKAQRIRSGIYRNLQSVWAMTDGITDAKFSGDKAMESASEWQTLIADITPVLSSETATYDWLGFWSQGNHDDRAFAALTLDTGRKP